MKVGVRRRRPARPRPARRRAGAGDLVAVLAALVDGQVDAHGVVRVAGGQLGPLLVVDHVVRAGDDAGRASTRRGRSGGRGTARRGPRPHPRRPPTGRGRWTSPPMAWVHAPRDRGTTPLRTEPDAASSMTWVLDLDGVVWLADQPIAGAAEAVARLRAGRRAGAVRHQQLLGPPRRPGGQARRHGDPGRRATCDLGHGGGHAGGARRAGAGVRRAGRACEALARAGRANPVGDGDADVVIVGFHRDFDYERLRRGGRRPSATAPASSPPTTTPPTRRPTGRSPVAASLVAAVAYAVGRHRRPWPGKPHRADGRPGPGASAGGEGTVVGDRPDTDGVFAATLGYRFALVLTGVTGRGRPAGGSRRRRWWRDRDLAP